jgi:hypothetical protein
MPTAGVKIPQAENEQRERMLCALRKINAGSAEKKGDATSPGGTMKK